MHERELWPSPSLVLEFAVLKDTFAFPHCSCFADKSLNTCQVLHGTISFLLQWCMSITSLFVIKKLCFFNIFFPIIWKGCDNSTEALLFYIVVCNEFSPSGKAKVCLTSSHPFCGENYLSLWWQYLKVGSWYWIVKHRKNKMVFFHATLFHRSQILIC